MILLQNSTPEVYYQQSRDFQYIGRLFDLVVNNINTNADLVYSVPLSANSDSRLIDLMTMTLGFKANHKYNVKQLTALCSAFAYVLRNKGSLTAIETAILTLFSAEGINLQKLEYTLESNNTVIKLFVPEQLSNINLLIDLMDYILPAGMSYELVRTLQKRLPVPDEYMTKLTSGSTVKYGVADGNDARLAKPNDDGNFKDYAAKNQLNLPNRDPATALVQAKDGIYTKAMLNDLQTAVKAPVVKVQQPQEDANNGETQETDETDTN